MLQVDTFLIMLKNTHREIHNLEKFQWMSMLSSYITVFTSVVSFDAA